MTMSPAEQHLREQAEEAKREAAKWRNFAESREKDATGYRANEDYHHRRAESLLLAADDVAAADRRRRIYGAEVLK